jgi:hypothetical protein
MQSTVSSEAIPIPTKAVVLKHHRIRRRFVTGPEHVIGLCCLRLQIEENDWPLRRVKNLPAARRIAWLPVPSCLRIRRPEIGPRICPEFPWRDFSPKPLGKNPMEGGETAVVCVHKASRSGMFIEQSKRIEIVAPSRVVQHRLLKKRVQREGALLQQPVVDLGMPWLLVQEVGGRGKPMQILFSITSDELVFLVFNRLVT